MGNLFILIKYFVGEFYFNLMAFRQALDLEIMIAPRVYFDLEVYKRRILGVL